MIDMDWTSVKDKLPEDGLYLVVLKDLEMNVGFVEMCDFHDGKWDYLLDGYKVTHWMELPKVPEETKAQYEEAL